MPAGLSEQTPLNPSSAEALVEACYIRRRELEKPGGGAWIEPTFKVQVVVVTLLSAHVFFQQFLVEWGPGLAAYYGGGPALSSMIVVTPTILMIVPTTTAPSLLESWGWRNTLVNMLSVILLCTLGGALAIGFRNLFLLVICLMALGMGLGLQYIGRQVSVATTSTAARNSAFAVQAAAGAIGSVVGFMVPTMVEGLTTFEVEVHGGTEEEVDLNVEGWTLAIPMFVAALVWRSRPQPHPLSSASPSASASPSPSLSPWSLMAGGARRAARGGDAAS